MDHRVCGIIRPSIRTYMEGWPPGRLDWPLRLPPPFPLASSLRPVRRGAATAFERFPARSRAPREVNADPLHALTGAVQDIMVTSVVYSPGLDGRRTLSVLAAVQHGQSPRS